MTDSIRHICLSLPLLLAALPLHAVQTESFTDDAVADFAQGDITTGTLTFRGTLQPPIMRKKLAEIDASVVWDIAETGDTVYTATGHEAKLFKQSEDGEPELFHKFDETALFSILPDKDDGLLVAASPGGTIYRLTEDSEPEVFARTGADLIWDMLWSDNELYVATGSEATILRVSDDGTTSTLASMPFALNILDMELDKETGDIVAATQGIGQVIRVSTDGKVQVLIDTEQEEVRRVAIMPDGSIVGAVNGERSPGEKLLERMPEGAKKLGNQKPRPESFLVRIYPDGIVREWWTSPESPIHDIHANDDGTLLVAAGAKGNLYLLNSEGESDIVGVAVEDNVTRLANGNDGEILIGTGAEAAIYRMTPGQLRHGEYDSRIFDAKGTVRWGRIRGVLDVGDGDVKISTRFGNTKEPDDTWSEWITPEDFDTGEYLSKETVSRFFQYKLHLRVGKDSDNKAPEVDVIKVFYTRPNEAPRVTSVSVQAPKDKAPATPQIVSTGRVIALPYTNSETLEITWTQEDPNNDLLDTALYLQLLGDENWTLVKDEIREPKYTLETRGIPDGEYRAKVVTNDNLVNEASDAKSGEAISPLFLVDNTAPEIEIVSVDHDSKESVSVEFQVRDSASLITGAAWRSGFDTWNLLIPEDNAADQKEETFSFTIEGEAAKSGGFVSIVASDEKGNATLQKVNFD